MEWWNGGMDFFFLFACVCILTIIRSIHNAKAEECTIPCIGILGNIKIKNWLGRVA